MIAFATHCATLTTFNLEGCDISNAAVLALATSCPNLVTINLAGCKEITDHAVTALATSTKLAPIASSATVSTFGASNTSIATATTDSSMPWTQPCQHRLLLFLQPRRRHAVD